MWSHSSFIAGITEHFTADYKVTHAGNDMNCQAEVKLQAGFWAHPEDEKNSGRSEWHRKHQTCPPSCWPTRVSLRYPQRMFAVSLDTKWAPVTHSVLQTPHSRFLSEVTYAQEGLGLQHPFYRWLFTHGGWWTAKASVCSDQRALLCFIGSEWCWEGGRHQLLALCFRGDITTDAQPQIQTNTYCCGSPGTVLWHPGLSTPSPALSGVRCPLQLPPSCAFLQHPQSTQLSRLMEMFSAALWAWEATEKQQQWPL